MLTGLEPYARQALLEFYAVNAEAVAAAQRFPADGFDERTATLLGRVGVLGETLWSTLPSKHPAAIDAMFAVGQVGMALAGPSLGALYWRDARRLLRFALDSPSDVFDKATRDQLPQFALACLYHETEPGTALKVDAPLDFPTLSLTVHEDEGDPEDDPVLVFEYKVAGPIPPDQAIAFSHYALLDNYGLAIGKLFASTSAHLVFQVILPRASFDTPVLADTCRLVAGLGLSARDRLRSDSNDG